MQQRRSPNLGISSHQKIREKMVIAAMRFIYLRQSNIFQDGVKHFYAHLRCGSDSTIEGNCYKGSLTLHWQLLHLVIGIFFVSNRTTCSNTV